MSFLVCTVVALLSGLGLVLACTAVGAALAIDAATLRAFCVTAVALVLVGSLACMWLLRTRMHPRGRRRRAMV